MSETKTSATTTNTKTDGRDARLRRYLENRQKQYDYYKKIIKEARKSVKEGMLTASEGNLQISNVKKSQAYPAWALKATNSKFIKRLWHCAWLEGQKYGRKAAEGELLANTAPRLPLSDNELRAIWNSNATTGKAFARAVEAAHGITYKRTGITVEEKTYEKPTEATCDND